MHIFIYVVYLTSLTVFVTEAEKCVLPLPRFSFFTPILFHENGTILTSENESEIAEDLTIESNGKVILSCNPNYFRFESTKKVLRGQCKGGPVIEIDGKLKNFNKDLSCEVRAIEEILKPIAGCLDGTSVEYGFTHPLTDESYVLGEACYSTDRGQTIFAHQRIHTGAEKKLDELALATYSNRRYFMGRHPNSDYKIKFMVAARLDKLNGRLTKLLGDGNIPSLEQRNYFGAETLGNKQFYSIQKLAWNYVMTTELDNLDILMDKIFELPPKTIDIYTGSHGVVKQRDGSGTPKEIYLDGDRYPVPEFIWFVVRDQNKVASFAILNNPKASITEQQAAHFCSSKCEQISWINTQKRKFYNDAENGLVLCCEYEDFVKTITEMPALQTTSHLEFWT